jgi:hypothetical protein
MLSLTNEMVAQVPPESTTQRCGATPEA